MRVRTILLTLLGVQLVLVGSLVLLAILMQRGQILAEIAVERRYDSYVLADELRQSSDDLSRFARTYAVTGKPEFKKYFSRIIAIRDGEAPRPVGYEGVYWDLVAAGKARDVAPGRSLSLRARMLAAGFTNAEFDKLSESQNRSDALVRLEEVAIHALEGRFDDGTGAFALTASPDRQRALDLLHGEEYHQAKAEIMAPIGEFISMIDERTRQRVKSLNAWERRLKRIDIAVSALLLLSTIVSVVLIWRLVLRPIEQLSGTAQQVASGDLSARATLSTTGEIGAFGATFDAMVHSVAHHVGELEKAREELAEQTEELEEQQERNERLLLNVLPSSIAERLKEGEEGIAESFPEVTVLFADIVGFTEMSAQVGARQVVDILNEVFGRLDELATKHKLEKIKTIGDCYMVVGGVPDRSATHAQQIAEFALDMQDVLQSYNEGSGQHLSMRTGIHTGTVVAGIVGTTKFAYDLWGDVVNIASRMESSGTPGEIQISDAVRIRLQDDYSFEDRGEVDLKGKGRMHTWHLTGRSRSSDSTANR